ncbi:MAG: DUF4288 domain-containing protein [Kiritimatiellia bacterium]
MKKQIRRRNRSSHGWWIATIVQRFEYFDEDVSNLNRRCTSWQNTILIQARNRNQAFRKAVANGKLGADSACGPPDGRQGRWVFEGLSSLLPVYDKLEDGAELIWEETPNITVRTVKSRVRQKCELECFQDD